MSAASGRGAAGLATVSETFARMMSGDITGMELNRLGDAGIPWLQFAKEVKGMGRTEFFKHINTLSIAGKSELIQQMTDYLGQVTDGAAAKQMNTIAGAWSNTKSAAFEAGAAMGAFVSPDIQSGLKGVENFLLNIADRLKEFNDEAERTGPLIAPLYNLGQRGLAPTDPFTGEGWVDPRTGKAWSRQDIFAATHPMRNRPTTRDFGPAGITQNPHVGRRPDVAFRNLQYGPSRRSAKYRDPLNVHYRDVPAPQYSNPWAAGHTGMGTGASYQTGAWANNMGMPGAPAMGGGSWQQTSDEYAYKATFEEMIDLHRQADDVLAE